MADLTTTWAGVVSAATGLGLYVAAAHEHLLWPEIVAGAVFVLSGALSLAAGRKGVVRKCPPVAVLGISVGILAPVVFGGALAALSIWGCIVVTRHFDVLPKAESDTLAEWIMTVALAILGLLIFSSFGDSESKIMPTQRTKEAFSKAFTQWFDPKLGGEIEIAYNAVFCDYVGTKNPINGWKALARLRRAMVIKRTIPVVRPPQPPTTQTPSSTA